MIPAERRVPEKEETWSLAPDQEHCAFFDEVPNTKPKGSQDPENTRVGDALGDPNEVVESGTLPRSQETRKSKTKKVKSYLRKCKGALSKGDEGLEKRRQEHCTSWYLDESQAPEDDIFPEKQTEFCDERVPITEDIAPVVLEKSNDNADSETLINSSRDEDGDEGRDGADEALARLLDEDRGSDLRRSRTSMYADARDTINEECTVDENRASKVDRSREERRGFFGDTHY